MLAGVAGMAVVDVISHPSIPALRELAEQSMEAWLAERPDPTGKYDMVGFGHRDHERQTKTMAALHRFGEEVTPPVVLALLDVVEAAEAVDKVIWYTLKSSQEAEDVLDNLRDALSRLHGEQG